MEPKSNSDSHSPLKRGEEKFTLLTNLRFIQRDNFRVYVQALLFSEGSIGIFEPSSTLRGFGMEAAWDNFSMWLNPEKHLPYTLEPTEDRSSILLSESGTAKPIFAGNNLTLKDGTTYFLQASDSSRPIDIHVQHGDICRVWEILAEKAQEYWTAPYMPRLTYGPARKQTRTFV